MTNWTKEQIEYWESQNDLEFLKYFKSVLTSIENYKETELIGLDLYVYNRYKKIIRDKKINLILDENLILNFKHFNNLFFKLNL
jgi:hypothetical protein